MTTNASERRKHASGVFSGEIPVRGISSSSLAARPRPPSSDGYREGKLDDAALRQSDTYISASTSHAERRAQAFRPHSLVFQSPFTDRSATATLRQARQEAHDALHEAANGRPHHLLQPARRLVDASAEGGGRPAGHRGPAGGVQAGIVNARPTSAAQAVQAASYFTREVLEGSSTSRSLQPGGDSDRAYLSRMGADSAILARRRQAADGAGQDDGTSAVASGSAVPGGGGRWSLPQAPQHPPHGGHGEVKLGGSIAAALPEARPPPTQGQQAQGTLYGAYVRGLSDSTANPFLRCPPLFEDVVRSSTAEYSVRPGTGRGETPVHPPLGEYINSKPGSARQLQHSSSVTHPAGRHSGRLGGGRTWSKGAQDAQQEHTLRGGEDEGLDDGGAGEQAWWLRSKTPSVAALLRARVAGSGAAGVLGPDGRPLTQNKADLLFRRRLHESAAQLSGAVHTSGKGIIQLLSSYLDGNWRPEELGGGGTFLRGSTPGEKVRSRKKYLPYALYSQATGMPARVAASRERNREAARSLASPVRATWGMGGTGQAGHMSPEAAAQRRLRNQQAVTSARIASLLGASDGGAEAVVDLAAWGSMAPVTVDVGQDEKLELNTQLPGEGAGPVDAEGSEPLDEPVHTSSIFNPYHSPIFTCDIPQPVRQRIAAARRAAEAGQSMAAGGQQPSSLGMTLADAMGVQGGLDGVVVPPTVSTVQPSAAPAKPPLARAKSAIVTSAPRELPRPLERSTSQLGASKRGGLASTPSSSMRGHSQASDRTHATGRRLTFDLPAEGQQSGL